MIFVNYFNDLLKKYNLNIDELIILILAFTIFLPFYISVVSLNIVFFYLLSSGKIINVIKSTKYSKNIFLFLLFTFVVAICNKNMYGIGVSVILFQFVIFFMYYRMIINRILFSKIINLYMIVSAFCFLITIVSVLYKKFIYNLDFYEFIDFLSLHRPVSSFFNTNYYATICEFIIIIAMYYFLSNKNKNNRLYFLFVSALSFIVLFLTENRTALPTILIATLVLSLSKKNKKVLVFVAILSVVIIALTIFSNRIFPRYEFIANSMDSRMIIWKNSISLFKRKFLFGSGPMAYQNAQFVSYPANHAHNILLDVLINFGIVGIIIVSPIFLSICRIVYNIKHKNLFRLVLALTSIVVLHGMLDVTILWHQCAFIYLSVILAVGKIGSFKLKFIFRS